MTKKLFLSHILGPSTPAYGGSKTDFIVEHARCMHKGDTCNAMRWTMSNHVGTHMDAPLHFDENGSSIDALSPDWCNFKNCQLINLPTEPGVMISEGRWCDEIKVDTEILLLKTDFESHRGTPLYWEKNPGLTPELGLFLRKTFPQLRAIGFDFISLTSYVNRPLGHVAHKAFLGSENPGKPIHIIEDMSLCNLNQSPQSILVVPFRVENADGAPVTVIADV